MLKNYEYYMEQAIAEALKAEFQTDPNPMVGAILVENSGEIISRGFHEKSGQPHAEVMALKDFTLAPENTTLFVTLEPCCHRGKTGPCTELIISKKVKTVVVGTKDPNPLVAGKGIQILRSHGIKVIEGICEDKCRNMNRVFNTHITQKRPFISAKAAISLDGKIAMPSGESQWITGEDARKQGHLLRSQHQAIAVGGNTLIKDNPKLTDRVSKEPRQPIRILFDSTGKLPLDSEFVKDTDTGRFLFAGKYIAEHKMEQFKKAGISVFKAETEKAAPDWALEILYNQGICSLLIEGGGELISSFMRLGLIDRLYLFLSGKIIGDNSAPSWCGKLGTEKLADVPQFKFDEIKKLGKDLMLTAYL